MGAGELSELPDWEMADLGYKMGDFFGMVACGLVAAGSGIETERGVFAGDGDGKGGDRAGDVVG